MWLDNNVTLLPRVIIPTAARSLCYFVTKCLGEQMLFYLKSLWQLPTSSYYKLSMHFCKIYLWIENHVLFKHIKVFVCVVCVDIHSHIYIQYIILCRTLHIQSGRPTKTESPVTSATDINNSPINELGGGICSHIVYHSFSLSHKLTSTKLRNWEIVQHKLISQHTVYTENYSTCAKDFLFHFPQSLIQPKINYLQQPHHKAYLINGLGP